VKIYQQQKASNWGAKLLEQLSSDLRIEFPAVQDLSKPKVL
jgi:hypothetical protein